MTAVERLRHDAPPLKIGDEPEPPGTEASVIAVARKTFAALGGAALAACGLALPLAAWQGLTTFGVVSSRLLASPRQVVDALLEMARDGTLWMDVSASVSRVAISLAIGIVAGMAVGIGTARLRTLRAMLVPTLRMLLPVPTLALIPVAILWFGLGEDSKIFLISMGVFFPVWVNTHAGISKVRDDYIRAAACVGASRVSVLTEVILPAALPTILAGVRLGIALSFVLLVAAEQTGTTIGLGYRLEMARLFSQSARLFALIVVFGVLGATADITFHRIGDRLTRWAAYEA